MKKSGDTTGIARMTVTETEGEILADHMISVRLLPGETEAGV